MVAKETLYITQQYNLNPLVMSPMRPFVLQNLNFSKEPIMKLKIRVWLSAYIF